MLARRRLLVRLLRLLVAVTALLVACPSAARSVVVDPIVRIAGAEDRVAVAGPEDRADDGVNVRVAPPRPALASELGRRLAPLQSTRALRGRVYLLHCALLR